MQEGLLHLTEAVRAKNQLSEEAVTGAIPVAKGLVTRVASTKIPPPAITTVIVRRAFRVKKGTMGIQHQTLADPTSKKKQKKKRP